MVLFRFFYFDDNTICCISWFDEKNAFLEFSIVFFDMIAKNSINQDLFFSLLTTFSKKVLNKFKVALN